MRRLLASGLCLALVGLAGCTGGDDPAPAPAPSGSTDVGHEATPATDLAVDDPSLDAALSEPVEDSVYPDIGDPGVDALHYDLALTWTPKSRTLDAVETLIFRSTEDDHSFQLDFSHALTASEVTVDGDPASYEQDGKDLVVTHDVATDGRYTVRIVYSGTPRPTAAPTTRSDFSTTGWTITGRGETWTMQEPYGAFTWFAVNDQPSDKALYDFTLSVPSPWVGVANGTLESRTSTDGQTLTQWHLPQPAASYLTTVAFGDFVKTKDESASGVPITYWTPANRPNVVRGLRLTVDGLDWLEKLLGPYPFDSLGILLVNSMSGMETQSMITLGTTDYTTSSGVLVHEMAHQWYGDVVTPSDWRDVWMNEGMAMYIEGLWDAHLDHEPIEYTMDYWAGFEKRLRRESGPPAAYDPARFGEGNIYYGPALMWDELRKRIGNDAFYALVREWPHVHEYANSNRDDYEAWVEDRTGLELSEFFDSWLLGAKSPDRTSAGEARGDVHLPPESGRHA